MSENQQIFRLFLGLAGVAMVIVGLLGIFG